jgi:DNA polymerase-3 subunit delta'
MLLGHAEAESKLLDAFNSGRMPHAWLITGAQGIGKATLAWRFARFLLVGDHGGGLFGGVPQSLDTDPGASAARQIGARAHPDLHFVRRTLNDKRERVRGEIVVDDVRHLGESMRMTAAGWRVAIVDAAEEMNANAANAILKLLEEPPPRSVMLLVSHAPGRLLPTIRSRCRRLPLQALHDADVISLIAELRPETPPGDLQTLARLAEGSVGRALQLAQAGGLKAYEALLAILELLPEPDVPALHGYAERLARRGEEADAEYRTVALLLDWWFKSLVRETAVGGGSTQPSREQSINDRLRRSASLDRWLEVWEKTAQLFARADAVNLDRKQVVLGSFLAIQTAMRG